MRTDLSHLQNKEDRSVVRGFVARTEQLRAKSEGSERADELERERQRVIREASRAGGSRSAALIATINVICDLVRKGWRARLLSKAIEFKPFSDDDRASRRSQLEAQRTEQLRKASVQSFIRSMEQSRWFGGKRVSIFNLMRDGRDLASALEGRDSLTGLQDVVKPYIQFARTDERCTRTGLLLTDIWRYFRLTWANPYQSVPGRSMLLLVRDAAVEHHPIFGLAAVSSASVKLRVRDAFLGWEPDQVLEELSTKPTKKAVAWLHQVLDKRIDEISHQDLVEDGLLSRSTLKRPSQEVLQALREQAKARRAQHHSSVSERGDYSDGDSHEGDEFWESQARTPLFRSKRAEELARLLGIRQAIAGVASAGELRDLMETEVGRRAIRDLARLAKSLTVGTAIGDLTVCGAVPPYSSLLGGKLVAMLAASPEVVQEYERRYSHAASVIASSMAGRRVVRPARLVFLGVTSLYRERPNQYDRISISSELVGGKAGPPIRYRLIGRSEGWGSFQFSEDTTRSIVSFLQSRVNGGRVNYVFGEGASPKFRALREGLAALGFDEEELLNHGHAKLLYGVDLCTNTKDYLLGRAVAPRYIFSLRGAGKSSAAITDWWLERWVLKRLRKPGLLDSMRQDTLVRPIKHRARVLLPQPPLCESD